MTAVVTGGSRGIGKGIAEALLNKGFNVIVTARNKGTEIEELEKAYGNKILFVPCDISKDEDAKRIVAETLEAFGKIDILINNAGIAQSTAFEKITPQEFDRIMDLFFFKEYSEWIYCAAISGDYEMEYYKKYSQWAERLAKKLGFEKGGEPCFA